MGSAKAPTSHLPNGFCIGIIYEKRAEVGAVVHTHSPHATSLACLRRAIPAFHYEVGLAGGTDIRCADYATFGTQELSDHAFGALDGRWACLLANHGVVAIGTDLDKRFRHGREGGSARAHVLAGAPGGRAVLLDAAEMATILEKFRTYGRE
jgi:L-fuculose-phosphate aldolase